MARQKQQYDEQKGNRIKESRIKKGFSRQQLVDGLSLIAALNCEYKDISTSLSAVKSWEGIGKKYSPDNTTLKAISEVLEVDFYWLLLGDVAPSRAEEDFSSLKIEFLKTISTDELLAEIKRRTDAS